MTPYFQTENATLYQGECLEAMSRLPDGSFDAIITDPPYQTTALKWDVIIPFAPMWEQLKRLIKPRGVIVLFGSQPFTSALIMSNPEWFKYQWVWEKQQPTGHLDAKRRPLKAHEDLIVFADGATTYNPQGTQAVSIKSGRLTKNGKGVYGRVGNPDYVQTQGNFPRSVIRISCVTHSQVHPTQKPVALMEYLIKTYTNENETVLDFTAGSGSTLVAALNTGRQCVGIEQDAGYIEIAAKRLTEATEAQRMNLWASEPIVTEPARQMELVA